MSSPCGCPLGAQHSHTAWLEAHIALSKLEYSLGKPLEWQERRKFIWEFQHQWDETHGGKIEP